MKRNSISAILSILALGLFTAFTANAQTQRNLSLEEAIALSLQNSNYLKLNGAKVTEASAALREAKERRLPDLSISGAYMRLNQPTVDLKLKTTGSSQAGENGGTGGTASAAGSIKVEEAMYGIANLSLPVFAGFRIQNGIDAARYLKKATELDAEHNREEIIENTVAAYSNLFKAKAALDIVKENLKQSRQRVADFGNLEKNGLMARNDLLKAQLQQSNVELSLLDAENNWQITNITMDLMLGLPENTELIPDTTAFDASAAAETFEVWETKALENRKDIAALDYRKKAAHAGVKAAQGDYYPSLALTGGYIAANVPNLLTITNALNVGAGLKYTPSSLWKTGAKVAQAKAQEQQLNISRNILTDNVRLQTAKAYQSYLVSQKKIDVYAKAMEQANENYRIVKNKYDNSLATTTDLLEADVAQLQARLNHAYAQADALVAYQKLLQTTGTINNK